MLVEGVQRWYEGRWVPVRGVLVYRSEEGVKLWGQVVGVSEKGYGKIDKTRITTQSGEVIRVKEGGNWVVKGVEDIKGRELYVEADVCGVLGLREVERLRGLEVGDDIGDEVVMEYRRLVVGSREGLEHLIESYQIMMHRSTPVGEVGVYVDKGVSFRGITERDIVCLGSGLVYVSKEQIREMGITGVTSEKRVKELPEWNILRYDDVMVYIEGGREMYCFTPEGYIEHYKAG